MIEGLIVINFVGVYATIVTEKMILAIGVPTW